MVSERNKKKKNSRLENEENFRYGNLNSSSPLAPRLGGFEPRVRQKLNAAGRFVKPIMQPRRLNPVTFRQVSATYDNGSKSDKDEGIPRVENDNTCLDASSAQVSDSLPTADPQALRFFHNQGVEAYRNQQSLQQGAYSYAVLPNSLPVLQTAQPTYHLQPLPEYTVDHPSAEDCPSTFDHPFGPEYQPDNQPPLGYPFTYYPTLGGPYAKVFPIPNQQFQEFPSSYGEGPRWAYPPVQNSASVVYSHPTDPPPYYTTAPIFHHPSPVSSTSLPVVSLCPVDTALTSEMPAASGEHYRSAPPGAANMRSGGMDVGMPITYKQILTDQCRSVSGRSARSPARYLQIAKRPPTNGSVVASNNNGSKFSSNRASVPVTDTVTLVKRCVNNNSNYPEAAPSHQTTRGVKNFNMSKKFVNSQKKARCPAMPKQIFTGKKTRQIFDCNPPFQDEAIIAAKLSNISLTDNRDFVIDEKCRLTGHRNIKMTQQAIKIAPTVRGRGKTPDKQRVFLKGPFAATRDNAAIPLDNNPSANIVEGKRHEMHVRKNNEAINDSVEIPAVGNESSDNNIQVCNTKQASDDALTAKRSTNNLSYADALLMMTPKINAPERSQPSETNKVRTVTTILTRQNVQKLETKAEKNDYSSSLNDQAIKTDNSNKSCDAHVATDVEGREANSVHNEEACVSSEPEQSNELSGNNSENADGESDKRTNSAGSDTSQDSGCGMSDTSGSDQQLDCSCTYPDEASDHFCPSKAVNHTQSTTEQASTGYNYVPSGSFNNEQYGDYQSNSVNDLNKTFYYGYCVPQHISVLNKVNGNVYNYSFVFKCDPTVATPNNPQTQQYQTYQLPVIRPGQVLYPPPPPPHVNNCANSTPYVPPSSSNQQWYPESQPAQTEQPLVHTMKPISRRFRRLLDEEARKNPTQCPERFQGQALIRQKPLGNRKRKLARLAEMARIMDHVYLPTQGFVFNPDAQEFEPQSETTKPCDSESQSEVGSKDCVEAEDETNVSLETVKVKPEENTEQVNTKSDQEVEEKDLTELSDARKDENDSETTPSSSEKDVVRNNIVKSSDTRCSLDNTHSQDSQVNVASDVCKSSDLSDNQTPEASSVSEKSTVNVNKDCVKTTPTTSAFSNHSFVQLNESRPATLNQPKSIQNNNGRSRFTPVTWTSSYHTRMSSLPVTCTQNSPAQDLVLLVGPSLPASVTAEGVPPSPPPSYQAVSMPPPPAPTFPPTMTAVPGAVMISPSPALQMVLGQPPLPMQPMPAYHTDPAPFMGTMFFVNPGTVYFPPYQGDGTGNY